MEYLHYFETASAFTEAYNGGGYEEPWVWGLPISAENNYELVEQKPAEWSEEDENKIKDIIDYLECWNDFDHGSESFEEYRKRMEDNIQFMKSLRPSWKPSEEQESVAERFAKIVRENITEMSKDAHEQFKQLYFEITGTKMYGGYKD